MMRTENAEEERVRVQSDRRKTLLSPLIVLKAKMEDERKTFFGYAKNISRGGMFISSVSPQDPGSRFRLEFPLPKPLDKTVQCDCEVVWTRSYTPGARYEPGMGLKFLDMSEESAQAIDTWVNAPD